MRPTPASAQQARRALQVLTDLTPSSRGERNPLMVPLDWLLWGPQIYKGRFTTPASDQKEYQRRLLAMLQLRGWPDVVRLGRWWVSGMRATDSGTPKPVFMPLVINRVDVPPIGAWVVDPEWYLPPGVSPQTEARLRSVHVGQFPGDEWSSLALDRSPNLQANLRGIAAELGLEPLAFDGDGKIPEPGDPVGDFRVSRGEALFVGAPEPAGSRHSTLDAFADKLHLTHTAFHSLYVDGDPPQFLGRPGAGIGRPRGVTAMPLTRRQEQILAASRDSAVQVIHGAPGTGKSHTITAIVADAVDRGESVLIAARNDASVDALDALFAAEASIDPVVFGSGARRRELGDTLVSLPPAVDPAEVDRLADAVAAAAHTRDRLRSTVTEMLSGDAARRDLLDQREQQIQVLTRRARAADIVEIRDIMIGRRSAAKWRRRGGRPMRRLRSLMGADASFSDEVVEAAAERIGFATDSPQAATPVMVSSAIGDLVSAMVTVEDRYVAYLYADLRSEQRLGRDGMKAITAVRSALRTGPTARRALLSNLTTRDLTTALPVWLGTLGDVDEVLPPVPALFDLVVIDEAASAEQRLGAAALLRGRRATIVGDPRQLRPVSFLSAEQIAAAHDKANVTGADRSILNVRVNSLFDAAASVALPEILNEQFRCAPHLFDLVARELYGGDVKVATRNPVTDNLDCVHLIDTRLTTTPTRTAVGTVQAEIDAVMRELRRLARSGADSVGVISPFRAQVDALEEIVMATLSTEEVLAMDLRIDTVHGFQGNERDRMLLSLGLTDDDQAGWRFVNDPNLLAVMLTRARQHMTVIASCNPRPDTTLGRYFAGCDTPPGPPKPVGPSTRWTEQVATGFELAGITPMRSYPCGSHIVDLAFARHGRPVGIICELHPDGVGAHIDRHVELIRLGWAVHELLPALCDHNPAPHIIEILTP